MFRWFRGDARAADRISRAVAKSERSLHRRFRKTHQALYRSWGAAYRQARQQIKALQRDLDLEQNSNQRLREEVDTLRMIVDELTSSVQASIERERARAIPTAKRDVDY